MYPEDKKKTTGFGTKVKTFQKQPGLGTAQGQFGVCRCLVLSLK
jgi:hypothetical protein